MMISPIQIAAAVLNIPDYSNEAELAKVAVEAGGRLDPYDEIMVAGYMMSAWRAKIAEARIFYLLGGSR